jgi:hypothetical protein
MNDARDPELARRLAELDAPQYGPEFYPSLWSAIADQGRSQAAGPRALAARPGVPAWPRRHAWAIAACVLAAVVAGLATAVSVPGFAAGLRLPLGTEQRVLRAQNHSLERALLGELEQNLALQAHVVAVDGGAALAARTPAERALAADPALAKLVRSYFATTVRAHTPGQAGAAARAALAAFFPAGSPALARARFVALGSRDQLAYGPGGDPAVEPKRGSLAVVRSVVFNRAHTRATLVVWPVVEYQLWIDASGRPRWDYLGGAGTASWGVAPGAAPHRLALVRSGARWLITDDFSLDREIPSIMKKGGAPRTLWSAEQRRIAAHLNTSYPVPAGIRAAMQRLCDLLNERRFTATDSLFASGHGFRARDFQHPHGSWRLTLQRVRRYDPLWIDSVSDPSRVTVVAEVSAPQDLFIAGGGGFTMAWTFEHTATGRWLITGEGSPAAGAGAW